MGNFLRAEARPIVWDEQHKTQQQALAQLARMLNEAVEAIQKTESDSTDWLDEDRTSRVAFLVGGRGTGKTSVMATLYKSCHPKLSPTDTKEFAGDVATTIQDMRSHLVWLEPLDAETVTESTNLLAAILARVEAVCQRVITKPGSREPIASLLSPEYQEPLQELQRLQTTIAMAWDYNLRDRRAQTDPTNMAAEALQYEKAKFSLDQNIKRTFKSLAKHCRFDSVSNPLFVLPVDDFDLNPSACVQLLKVIRMVSIPQLFFLVLGDMDIAEVVMNLHQSADLVRVTRDVRDIRYVSTEPEDVAKVAAEIAGNTLRKLIPPAQRVHLLKPTLLEALNFQPLGSADSTPRLHELLDKFPTFVVNADPAKRGQQTALFRGTLRQHILQEGHRVLAAETSRPPKISKGDLQEADLSGCCYTARGLFRTSLRRLADIWADCNQLLETYRTLRVDDEEASEKKTSRSRTSGDGNDESRITKMEATAQDDIRRFLQVACRDLLSEEPALGPKERARLAESFRRTPGGDWYLGNIPLQITSRTQPATELESTLKRFGKKFSSEFHFRRFDGWQFSMSDRSDSRRTINDWLRPQTAAMMTLFHDFVVMGNWNRNIGSFVLDKPQLTADWAATVWKSGLTEVRLPWPAPPCLSVFALDRFAFAWNDFLERADSDLLETPEGIKIAAFAWISAGTAAVDNELPETWLGKSDEEYWPRLQERLNKIVPNKKSKSFQSWRCRQWLCSVASFLMPEMTGLIGEQYGDRTSPLSKFWRVERASIKRQRGLRLAKLSVRFFNNLVESLLGSFEYLDEFNISLKDVKALVQNENDESLFSDDDLHADLDEINNKEPEISLESERALLSEVLQQIDKASSKSPVKPLISKLLSRPVMLVRIDQLVVLVKALKRFRGAARRYKIATPEQDLLIASLTNKWTESLLESM